MRNAANLVGFQAAWWAAVLLAARGLDGLSILAVLAAASLHFGIWRQEWRREVLTVVVITSAGFIIESAFTASGAYGAPGWRPAAFVCPVWLAFMWTNLAVTLNASLGWMAGRPLAAAVFGAIGGPSSYYAAARFGAITMPEDPTVTLVALTAAWAAMTPALFVAARWVAGIEWVRGEKVAPRP